MNALHSPINHLQPRALKPDNSLTPRNPRLVLQHQPTSRPLIQFNIPSHLPRFLQRRHRLPPFPFLSKHSLDAIRTINARLPDRVPIVATGLDASPRTHGIAFGT
ncbi:MAG: hypothetical protein M1835_003509 [Candelina submexicana]|nr:MAG: hypothetical protein M1835_003509 [Candelina submexicana]